MLKMNEVSPEQIDLYGKELTKIADKLVESLDQIEADIITINDSVEKLKDYNEKDATEAIIVRKQSKQGYNNIEEYIENNFIYLKYIWDISVDSSDMSDALSIIRNTKDAINNLRLSGTELNEFSKMLSSTISTIEVEILGNGKYTRTDYTQYNDLSDLFNTIKDDDIWQEYKQTATYSKELKKRDLLYNRYRTKIGDDDYVDFLLDEIGNHRMSTDNKNTKYGIWFNKKYGMMNYNDAFCAAGVSYTLANSGNENILEPYINVAAGAKDAQLKASKGIGTWHSASDLTYHPKRGDIFYKGGDHTGVVLDSDENYIYTIEANTSSDEGVAGSVNTRIRKLNEDAYITTGGYYSPPIELSSANDQNVILNQNYINSKLNIQSGTNE